MRVYMPPETQMVEPDPTLCPECQGRGWKVEPDGGAGVAVDGDHTAPWTTTAHRSSPHSALANSLATIRTCRPFP